MPPTKKRLEAAVPDTERAIAALERSGSTRQAQAVSEVLAYALHAAKNRAAAARRESAADPPFSVLTDAALRDHAHVAAAAENREVTAVVRERLEAFVAGSWTPPPVRRARRGQASDKKFLNVRVPQALWDAVEARGKDPAAVEERGYVLTARNVVVQAVAAEWPLPADAGAEAAG